MKEPCPNENNGYPRVVEFWVIFFFFMCELFYGFQVFFIQQVSCEYF